MQSLIALFWKSHAANMHLDEFDLKKFNDFTNNDHKRIFVHSNSYNFKARIENSIAALFLVFDCEKVICFEAAQ